MNRVAIVFLMGLIMVLFSLISNGEYRENGRHYSWEPNPSLSTPREIILDYLYLGPKKYGWEVLAINIPIQLAKIKELDPDLRSKLLEHAEEMLSHLGKSESVYEIEVITSTLTNSYKNMIGFESQVDIAKVAHNRYVVIGRELFHRYHCETNKDLRETLSSKIDDVIKRGVLLSEIEQINLNNCEK